jgi:hypothetical protein
MLLQKICNIDLWYTIKEYYTYLTLRMPFQPVSFITKFKMSIFNLVIKETQLYLTEMFIKINFIFTNFITIHLYKAK